MAKKSEGFGTALERAITLARLDRIQKLVIKDDCSGCAKRKKKLNNPNLLVNKIFYNGK